MKTQPDHIDKILPYGEMLRAFTNQSYLTKGDLKRVLRERGIFTNSTEKEILVPVAVTLLLSPKEFDELRESQNTREDNPKRNSSTIPWSSSTNLIEAVPVDFDLKKIIDQEYSNYEILGSPNFTKVDNDPNRIILEYEIERNDLNKSWCQSKSNFKGSILIEKSDSGNAIKIVHTHTAPETKEIGSVCIPFVVSVFKEKNHIDPKDEVQKIIFSEFTNEERIVFFKKFTSHIKSNHYKFVDVVDIEFKPCEINPLPTAIDWMKKKKELSFKGAEIHETFFIKEKEYHPHIEVWKMDAKFEFKLLNVSGYIVASFGFPAYAKANDKDAEFEFNISNMSFNEPVSPEARLNHKQFLLQKMDELKTASYNSFKQYQKSAEV